MCGVAGLASLTPLVDRTGLLQARDKMLHRGPDDAGIWFSPAGNVGLSHRRLAIIDLSANGHQPMHFPEAGLSIVFNGEIYNYLALKEELSRLGYLFRSSSDTEVLLAAYAAWGTDCLTRLNGMFALAIFDQHRNRLFLARDRAGEKPLFYTMRDGALSFASELKALLHMHPDTARVSTAALDCYLAMGFVPGDRCILQDFHKLPPAHALCYELASGTVKVWRYWQLPELAAPNSGPRANESELVNELEVLLEDAVRLQMVADVPLGILLSGGVDSSLVTAMAVRHSARVHTFSIRFPGYGALDETPHARLIARHFGTEHLELDAGQVTEDLIPLLARQFDEPIVDSSMIPTYLVSQLVRKHCTVALGGDGGDELFGGYQHYSRLLWMQKRFRFLPLILRRAVARSAEKLLAPGVKGRNWVQGLAVNLENDLPLIASYFDAGTRSSLLDDGAAGKRTAEEIRSRLIPHQQDLLQRATRMDFNSYLAEDILVKVDRASMLNSLEVRAPMLDYRLIEFAYGKVPSSLKATAEQKKILLKRLAARVLPKEFDLQRKQGFSIPLAQWLKAGPFRELFRSVLLDSRCVFSRKAVEGLLKGQDKGRSNSERLFALVMFELWRREYGVSV